MKGIGFGPGNLDFIELTLWGIDPTSKSTPNHLATHVAKMMSDTTAERQFDENLFYAYREEFEDWSIDMFAALPRAVRRQLKIFLRTRGVFTGRNNGKIAPQLMELTTLEEPWQWIQAELAQTEFVLGSRFYTDKKTINFHKARVKLQTPDLKIPKPETPITYENLVQQPPNPPNTAPSSGLFTKRYDKQNPEQLPSRSPYPGPTPYTSQFCLVAYDPYSSLPPVPVPNERLDSSTMLQFIKTYDRNKMYTGNPYDLLDDKLKIFIPKKKKKKKNTACVV